MVLGVISVIIQLAFRHGDGTSSHQPFSSYIPKTLSTALAHFNLDGETTVYAICPSCDCTFPPQEVQGVPTYPTHCTNKAKPGSGICGASLLESTSSQAKPIKTFVYHHFNDYLAGLLARPDIEKIMDDRCDQMKMPSGMGLDSAGSSTNNGTSSLVTDVLEARFIRTFKGPSGTTLFMDRPGGEGRYAFVLNVDFYNPEGMRVRGASASCGIVAMACLNLPLSIRYKPENLYLAGIIPGPREPHLTSLNHYLQPLIADMAASWIKGTYFSRTASSLHGRLTRSAIIAVVCDLQAARKVAQMSPPKSHFYCSRCKCYHLKTLGRVDAEKWECRDVGAIRSHARNWKDALSSADQDKIFAAHGVRWSVLWELPYWDPTHQLVVDSMHCLFEGLVKHHVKTVLALTSASASSKFAPPAFVYDFLQYQESSSPSLNKNTVSHITQIHQLLTMTINDPNNDDDDVEMATADGDDTIFDSYALRGRLVKKTKAALEFVANSLSVYPMDGTGPGGQIQKVDLANALVDWVSSIYLLSIHFLIILF